MSTIHLGCGLTAASHKTGSSELLKCNYSFSCCMTIGWMRNILHSQCEFYRDCQSARSRRFGTTSLVFYCTSGTAYIKKKKKKQSVMHGSENISCTALDVVRLKNRVCRSICCASVHPKQTSRVILGQEVYFCLIILSWPLLVRKTTHQHCSSNASVH